MKHKSCRIVLIAGTRPNIMKVAPLYKVLSLQEWCEPRILFISQHKSPEMAGKILEDFSLLDRCRLVDLNTEEYGARIGEIISKVSAELLDTPTDLLIAPGDVDTSAGATLAARRAHIPVAHLEAGLRSFDESMPEETNRKLIDALSDVLLAPSEAAANHLMHQEGRAPKDVHFVGNIMIDSLVSMLDRELDITAATGMEVRPDHFALVTLHRPSNVDDPARLFDLCRIVGKLSQDTPIIFPVHPRTRKNLAKMTEVMKIITTGNVHLTGPLPYRVFINLLASSKYILTDSGGIQEEAAYLGIPCFTLRETTERPITVHHGLNALVSPYDIERRIASALAVTSSKPARPPIPLWDGQTAWRIAHILRNWWSERSMGGLSNV